MWKVCYDSLRFPRLFSFKSLEENRTYSRKHLQKFLPPQLVHQRYHFTCLLQLVPFTFRNIFFPFLLFSRVTTICLVKSCKLSEPTYLLSFHSTFWDILYAPRHLIVVFYRFILGLENPFIFHRRFLIPMVECSNYRTFAFTATIRPGAAHASGYKNGALAWAGGAPIKYRRGYRMMKNQRKSRTLSWWSLAFFLQNPWFWRTSPCWRILERRAVKCSKFVVETFREIFNTDCCLIIFAFFVGSTYPSESSISPVILVFPSHFDRFPPIQSDPAFLVPRRVRHASLECIHVTPLSYAPSASNPVAHSSIDFVEKVLEIIVENSILRRFHVHAL